MTKGQPNGEPNVKVRMLGVTAPDASDCGGADSITNLAAMFQLNEQVTVTYEPTLSETADKGGNILAYVVIGAGVTKDIGLRMVEDGFAAASYPEGQAAPKKFDRYAELGQIAVDQKLGI